MICLKFHRQGFMDNEIFIIDEVFERYLEKTILGNSGDSLFCRIMSH